MNLTQIAQPSKTDFPSLFTVPSPAGPTPEVSHGEKAKARDILAAIRTLKAVEQDGRPATTDERQALARFPGSLLLGSGVL